MNTFHFEHFSNTKKLTSQYSAVLELISKGNECIAEWKWYKSFLHPKIYQGCGDAKNCDFLLLHHQSRH